MIAYLAFLAPCIFRLPPDRHGQANIFLLVDAHPLRTYLKP